MALSARYSTMRACQQEVRGGVVERRNIFPVRSVVARLATRQLALGPF